MSLLSNRARLNRLARPVLCAGALALAVVSFAGTAQAQKLCFRAVIDGPQEPTPSTALGTGYFEMDRAANTLSIRVTYTGLGSAETAAHIHGFSGPGVPSGIKFALPLGNTKTAVWNYTEPDEASIINGLTYVNIHSMTFPNGEIRGQIIRDDSNAFMTSIIDGPQEPTASPALGTGYISVDTVANTITYRLTYHGLTSPEGAAHIHGFSGPGVPAGIKFVLPLGSTKSGTVGYPEIDEANYLAGLSYFNIHTTAFPNGEIRGQIVPGCTNPSSYCTAKVNALGCTPAIAGTGTPSPSATSGFVVTGSNVRNNKSGLLFYGINGGQAVPFTGGTLCVAAPIRRTPGVNSGGTPAPANDCTGVYSIDMNTFAQGGLGGTPLPALQVSGTIVCCQFWGRDPGFPAPGNTTLTDGLQYTIP